MPIVKNYRRHSDHIIYTMNKQNNCIMITSIIDIFRRQARQHKIIQAFYYNRNYELGSGKDRYPLFWLEDPVYGRNENNTFTNSVNFSILFVPDSRSMVQDLQNLAFSAGLNILERIKKDASSPIHIEPDWTYTTLRDYYDDKACGCRFSVNFTQRNMQNLCLIEEQFDKDKEFAENPSLNDFELKGSVEVFRNKFPDFDLKIQR